MLRLTETTIQNVSPVYVPQFYLKTMIKCALLSGTRGGTNLQYILSLNTQPVTLKNSQSTNTCLKMFLTLG